MTLFGAYFLQVRRERFIEELESYQKQVEEFTTYGDMNDIQKYLRKSQNLETKLTAAAEKVKKNLFNHIPVQK